MNKMFDEVVAIVAPFAKNKEALKAVSRESAFFKDLQVSSSRLVDIVLDIEDKFGIEISDSEVDGVISVGDVIDLIAGKSARGCCANAAS